MVDPSTFLCGICDKGFERRDLLARHQKRCQNGRKSIRRKACDACVRTKSKCCLTRPVCSRCQNRHLECVYFSTMIGPEQGPLLNKVRKSAFVTSNTRAIDTRTPKNIPTAMSQAGGEPRDSASHSLTSVSPVRPNPLISFEQRMTEL